MRKYPPDLPPEVPIVPTGAVPTTVPIPIVYEDSILEYRVASVGSHDVSELETALNSAGRDGWWLIQTITREEQLLLVFVRQQEAKRRS